MKRTFLALLLLITAAAGAAAQKEKDFVAHFTAAATTADSLTCRTVSPKMMKSIVELMKDGEGDQTGKMLTRIKSVRLVTANDGNGHKRLYERAAQLAGKNARRYKAYAQTPDTNVYVRRRGKYIVEIVIVSFKDNRHFALTDITGNMTDGFISQLMKP